MMKATILISKYKEYLEKSGHSSVQVYSSKAATAIREKVDCNKDILPQFEEIVKHSKHTMHAVIIRFLNFLKENRIHQVENDLPSLSEQRKLMWAERGKDINRKRRKNRKVLAKSEVSKKDLIKVLNSLPIKEAAIFSLLAFQGITRENIISIKKSKIDLKNCHLELSNHEGIHEIKLFKSVVKILKTYLKTTNPTAAYLFEEASCRSVDVVSSKAFQILQIKAGVYSTRFWYYNALFQLYKYRVPLGFLIDNFLIGQVSTIKRLLPMEEFSNLDYDW